MTGDRDEALRAVVHGRVQGVGFRMFVVFHARQLRLAGFARNLSDGRTVEVVAEDPRTELENLLSALRQGPTGSHVLRVDTS